MFTIVWYFGSLKFTERYALARSGHFQIGDPILTAAALLLFVGACGKSAQIPLYVWLPDAMEGPTPVSALDPRRDDGDRRRLHGRALECDLRARPHSDEDGCRLSVRSPPFLPRRLVWCKTTSSACSPTRPFLSSATCFLPSA